MPLNRTTKVFGVTHAQIEVLTADTAGTAPTYGTAIDLPGIKSVTITGDIETKQLRGDNTVLDEDSVLTGIGVSFETAKVSLDFLAAALTTPAIVDAGTTPAQTSTLNITNTSKLRPFRFKAIAAGADPVAGTVLMTLHKVVLSSFPELGMAEEDYKTAPVEGRAMPILGTGGLWLSVQILETTPTLTGGLLPTS
jgi:hypothetical protein